MHICRSCGQPLMNNERSNIQISFPNGYQHITCPEVVKEDVKKEEVIIPSNNISDDNDDEIENDTLYDVI